MKDQRAFASVVFLFISLIVLVELAGKMGAIPGAIMVLGFTPAMLVIFPSFSRVLRRGNDGGHSGQMGQRKALLSYLACVVVASGGVVFFWNSNRLGAALLAIQAAVLLGYGIVQKLLNRRH